MGVPAFSEYPKMKVSLVLEDSGAGPQVIFTSNCADEARRFYKARTAPGKLELIVNPRPDFARTIKASPVVEVPVMEKPVTRRKAEPATLI